MSEYVDRSNYMQQKYRERLDIKNFFNIKCHRFLERHKKKLDEIANRKTKTTKVMHETDIGTRLNENKKLIHEIQLNRITEFIFMINFTEKKD